MELNDKDLELIAKIDERLKQLGLINDNKYPDEEPNPEVIKFYDRYFKKADNEQEAPVEWKVGEWFDANGLFLITGFNSVWVKGDNQDGETGEYHIEAITKPTKEEIEQHLVKIAEKKYPVGAKVKCLHDCQDLTIGNDFTAHLEFDGEALRYTKEGFGVTAIWCEHETNKWAKIISEPITEQKERWKPNSGEEYYYINEVFTIQPTINSHFMLDSPRIEAGNCFKTQEEAERAAQAIRETLKNL